MTVGEFSGKMTAYNKLGAVGKGLIQKLISSKMPGGFSMSKVKVLY
jgi:3-oxoacyl-ACP reductase-like protein